MYNPEFEFLSLDSPEYLEAAILNQSLYSLLFPQWLIKAKCGVPEPYLQFAVLSRLFQIISITALCLHNTDNQPLIF